jgi:hypothetical protein
VAKITSEQVKLAKVLEEVQKQMVVATTLHADEEKQLEKYVKRCHESNNKYPSDAFDRGFSAGVKTGYEIQIKRLNDLLTILQK